MGYIISGETWERMSPAEKERAIRENGICWSLTGRGEIHLTVKDDEKFYVDVRVRNGRGDILYEGSFSGHSYEQTFSLLMDGSQCRPHGKTNWHVPEEMYRDGFFPYPH